MSPIKIGLAALALTAASAMPVAAQQAKVGVLGCNVSGSIGLIVTSNKQLSCTFQPSARGWRREVYVGNIRKLGIDIGFTGRGRLVWAVFSTAPAYARGALAGDYGGVTAGATVGVGLDANVLVGGNSRQISLQPLSVQGQTGANLSAGVADLSLRFAR